MEARIKKFTNKKLITIGQLPEQTLAVIEECSSTKIYNGLIVFKLKDDTLISLDGRYWRGASSTSFLVRVLGPDELVEVHN